LLYRFSPFLSIKPSLKSLGKNDLPIILSKILNKIQKRTRNKKITRYIEILSFKKFAGRNSRYEFRAQSLEKGLLLVVGVLITSPRRN